MQAHFSTNTSDDIGWSTSEKRTFMTCNNIANIDYDPCLYLPDCPNLISSKEALSDWINSFNQTSDEIIYLSNRHSHSKHCQRGVDKHYWTYFPCEVHAATIVESNISIVLLNQLEPAINHVSKVLLYSLQSNHNITYLQYRTQAHTAMAYVTNYVTKSLLKSHAIFSAIKSILDSKTKILSTCNENPEITRKLLTRIVKTLTA